MYISFEYMVNGQLYESSNVGVDDGFLDRREAVNFEDSFKNNKLILVKYNKDNPSEAYCFYKIIDIYSGNHLFLLIIGGLLIVVPFILGDKKRKHKQTEHRSSM